MNPLLFLLKREFLRQKNKMLACKHISKFSKQLFRKDLDAVVKITLNEEYNTARKKDGIKTPLVTIFNNGEENYHIYIKYMSNIITNIQKKILDAKDITKLNGEKLNLEPFFKELRRKILT
jgi:hypothetical protein